MHKAREAGLTLFDRSRYYGSGWDEVAACVDSTAALVRGVELPCAREGITVHLLSHLPDPTNEALLSVQRRATESRLTQARKEMV